MESSHKSDTGELPADSSHTAYLQLASVWVRDAVKPSFCTSNF